jgi:hypothetical protein
MTKLKVFAQTSDLPYDRHQYVVHHKNGKVKQFDNWDDTQSYWFQTESSWLSHIEVIEKKQIIKGFGG